MAHLTEAATGSKYARCGCKDCVWELAMLREAHVGAVHDGARLRWVWLRDHAEFFARRIRNGQDVTMFFAPKTAVKQAPKPAVEAAPNPLEGWTWAGWRGYGPRSGRIA